MKLLRKIPLLGQYLLKLHLKRFIETEPNSREIFGQRLESMGYFKKEFRYFFVYYKGKKIVKIYK